MRVNVTTLGGYVVDVDNDRLADAPRYGAGEDPFTDDEYGARVDAYHKTTPPPDLAAPCVKPWVEASSA